MPEAAPRPPAWPARTLVALFLGSVWLARDYMVLETIHVYGTVAFVILLYYERLAHARGKPAIRTWLARLDLPAHILFLGLAAHALWPAVRATLAGGAGSGAWRAWWITAGSAGLFCLAAVLRRALALGREPVEE